MNKEPHHFLLHGAPPTVELNLPVSLATTSSAFSLGSALFLLCTLFLLLCPPILCPPSFMPGALILSMAVGVYKKLEEPQISEALPSSLQKSPNQGSTKGTGFFSNWEKETNMWEEKTHFDAAINYYAI